MLPISVLVGLFTLATQSSLLRGEEKKKRKREERREERERDGIVGLKITLKVKGFISSTINPVTH